MLSSSISSLVFLSFSRVFCSRLYALLDVSLASLAILSIWSASILCLQGEKSKRFVSLTSIQVKVRLSARVDDTCRGVLLVGELPRLLGQQRQVVGRSGAAGRFDVLSMTSVVFYKKPQMP